MSETSQTATTFREKWFKNPDVVFQNTLDENSDVHRWIVNRNGYSNDAAWRKALASRKRVLDAGCGNGRVTALLRGLTNPETTQVVGIDLVAADVAAKNLEDAPNVAFHTKDLLGDLTDLGKFDYIYCQEVLHHTSDPRASFLNLAKQLERGGEIAIYVYKQKAPVREYVDDLVRQRISNLTYDESMKVCSAITEMGKALSEVKAEITVPEIAPLEIPAGKYDVQRFFYHFFMKAFWNPEMTFHENVVINYDWYHPQLCYRHTLPEVLGWFEDAGLKVTHQHVDFYGITVKGELPSLS